MDQYALTAIFIVRLTDMAHLSLVQANIYADRVYIVGKVQGKIHVKERMTIQSNGKFFCNVRTPVFIIKIRHML